MLDFATTATINVTSGQDEQRETQVADGSFDGGLAVALLFLSALIVASNCLTILAICTTKVLKTLQNIFIVALAGADVFVGVGLLALLVQRHFRPPRRWIECQYSIAILYSSITLSLFIMLCVALDRYVYIVRPFFYRRHINARRIKACLLVQWLMATAHGFMAAYLPKKETVEKCNPLAAFQITFVKYMFPVVFCSVCAGIFILYGLIARTAKRHWDRRAKRLRKTTHIAASSSRAAELGGKEDLLDQSCSIAIDSSAIVLTKLTKSVPLSMKADKCPRVIQQEVQDDNMAALYVERSLMHEDRKCKLRQTENALDVDSSISEQDDTRILTGHDVIELSGVDLGAFTKHLGNTEAVTKQIENLASKSESERRSHDPGLPDAKKHSGQTPLSFCGSRYSCPSNDCKNHVTFQLTAVTLDTSSNGQRKTPISMRSLKWLRMIAIVFGLFTLCWSPTMIAILVSWKHQVPKELSSVFAMLGLANSAVNFFVYALHTRQFRRAIFRRVTCRCRD